MTVNKYFITSNLIIFILLFYSQFSLSQTHISTHAVHYKKNGIVNQNLILHLDASNSSSLNQNDLSIWNDLTSNNNDLSLFSGTMQFSSDAGGSLVFDNDIYRRSSNLNNMSHSNISISIWIKSTSSNGYVLSLSRTPSNFTDEFILKLSSGKVQFWDYSTNIGFLHNNSNRTQTSVNDGNWKFITFTKDNTTGRYFINGVADNVNPVTASRNVDYGDDNLIIGKNWRDNNEIFVGSIGAIYLYTKTLSQDEITQNYNATKSRYGH